MNPKEKAIDISKVKGHFLFFSPFSFDGFEFFIVLT